MRSSFTRRPLPPSRSTRVARGIAAGRSVARVAAAERLEAAEIEAIVGEDGFALIVEHYRDLLALHPEPRLERLVTQCWQVLVWAAEDGDLMAACWVVHHHQRGQCPATRLARRVMSRLERDGPPPLPPAESRVDTASGPREESDRPPGPPSLHHVEQRLATRVDRELVAEHLAEVAVVAAQDAEIVEPASPISSARRPTPPLLRRESPLLPRLLRGAAPVQRPERSVHQSLASTAESLPRAAMAQGP